VELIIINKMLTESALVSFDTAIFLRAFGRDQLVLNAQPPQTKAELARESMFLGPDETRAAIGADRLWQIAFFREGLPTDRNQLLRTQRRASLGERIFQDRFGGSHIPNLQEGVFLLRAIELPIDDEIHLPQLMQAGGAPGVLQWRARAARLPGEFRILMQEAFNRAPMREAFESAAAKLPLDELGAPFEVEPFDFKNRLALALRRLMCRRLYGPMRDSFKPLLTEVSKAAAEFLDATGAQAEALGDSGD